MNVAHVACSSIVLLHLEHWIENEVNDDESTDQQLHKISAFEAIKNYCRVVLEDIVDGSDLDKEKGMEWYQLIACVAQGPVSFL